MVTSAEIPRLVRAWNAWKSLWRWLKQRMDKVDQLEARIAALESALAKRPADGCPYCGERAMRMIWSSGIQYGAKDKYREEQWRCASCGKMEERLVKF